MIEKPSLKFQAWYGWHTQPIVHWCLQKTWDQPQMHICGKNFCAAIYLSAYSNPTDLYIMDKNRREIKITEIPKGEKLSSFILLTDVLKYLEEDRENWLKLEETKSGKIY